MVSFACCDKKITLPQQMKSCNVFCEATRRKTIFGAAVYEP